MSTTGRAGHRGFTLVELMIALGIAAFLLTVALPNLGTFLKNNRLVTQVNSFIGAVHFARGQAITRRIPVSICKTDDQATCGSSGVQWEQGWFVFVDHDRDGTVDLSQNDEILSVWPALENGNTLRGNSNVASRVTFDPNGFTGNNGSLVLCDDRGFNHTVAGTLIKRLMVISSAGRVRTDTDAGNLSLASLCP